MTAEMEYIALIEHLRQVSPEDVAKVQASARERDAAMAEVARLQNAIDIMWVKSHDRAAIGRKGVK